MAQSHIAIQKMTDAEVTAFQEQVNNKIGIQAVQSIDDSVRMSVQLQHAVAVAPLLFHMDELGAANDDNSMTVSATLNLDDISAYQTGKSISGYLEGTWLAWGLDQKVALSAAQAASLAPSKRPAWTIDINKNDQGTYSLVVRGVPQRFVLFYIRGNEAVWTASLRPLCMHPNFIHLGDHVLSENPSDGSLAYDSVDDFLASRFAGSSGTNTVTLPPIAEMDLPIDPNA